MDLRILEIKPDSNAETKAPSQNLSFLTIAVINLHFQEYQVFQNQIHHYLLFPVLTPMLPNQNL